MEFKGTKGKWHWVEYTSNELPELMNGYHEKVCGFGNNYDYYPTEGEPPNEYDKLLISKAPELLEFVIHVYNSMPNGSSLQEKAEKLIKEATEL